MKKRYLLLFAGLYTATMATAAPNTPSVEVYEQNIELLAEDMLLNKVNESSRQLLQINSTKSILSPLLDIPANHRDEFVPKLPAQADIGHDLISDLIDAKTPSLSSMPSILSDGNDTPNEAQFVSLGSAQANHLSKENDQDWYFVQAPAAGKLTFYLQVPNNADLDYNLNIFRLDNGALVEQQFSSYPAQIGEQIAVEATEQAIYLFAVNTVKGFSTTEPYAFIVTHNTEYDTDEPDDNIWQATGETGTRIINNTLDHTFDADVYGVNFSESTIFGIYFKPHADLPSQVEVLNNAGIPIAIVTDRNIYNFPAGTYFLRVKQTADATLTPAQRTYKLHTYLPGNLKSITNYSLAPEQFAGLYKVEQHCIRLSTHIYDINNTPVPYANIPYQVYLRGWDSGWSNRLLTGTITADENGKLYKAIRLSWTMSTSYDIDNFFLLDPSFPTDVPLMGTPFIHYWTGSYGC